MKFLGKITFGVLTALYRGWVLTHLWLWFVVPVTRMDPIGVVQGIGLMWVIGIFKGIGAADLHALKDLEGADEIFHTYVLPVVAPTACMFFGWIWHFFL